MLFDSLSFQMFPESSSDSGGAAAGGAASASASAGLFADLLRAETSSSFLKWTFSNGMDIHGGTYLASRFLQSSLPFSDINKNNETSDFNKIRVYGCYQSLMKLHPLFDVALIKVFHMLDYPPT